MCARKMQQKFCKDQILQLFDAEMSENKILKNRPLAIGNGRNDYNMIKLQTVFITPASTLGVA